MDVQGHLTLAMMDDYVGKRLDDVSVYMADEHLASCAECAKQIRVLREVELYFQKWTPTVHGSIYRAAQFESILATATAHYPALRGRLTNWLKQKSGSVGAAVRAVWKQPGELTCLVNEKLEHLLPLRPGQSFSFASSPVRVLGKPGDNEPPALDVTKAQIRGDVFVEVSLDEVQGAIEVCLSGIRQTPPLVLLIDAERKQASMVELPEYQLETNCFICQFTQIPSGNYLIVVEPWE